MCSCLFKSNTKSGCFHQACQGSKAALKIFTFHFPNPPPGTSAGSRGNKQEGRRSISPSPCSSAPSAADAPQKWGRLPAGPSPRPRLLRLNHCSLSISAPGHRPRYRRAKPASPPPTRAWIVRSFTCFVTSLPPSRWPAFTRNLLDQDQKPFLARAGGPIGARQRLN